MSKHLDERGGLSTGGGLRLLAASAFVLACGVLPATAQSATGPGSQTAVCIYNDLTYSAGAAICPQARFMLTCTAENDRLVWKIADQALSNRCVAATVSAARPVRRHFSRRATPIRTAATAPTPAAAAPAARCFVFNNKRYCE